MTVPVLIAGGGSVGLSLAAELAHRGVECLVVEELVEVNPHPRANAVASRTMEYYRRWGIADFLVESGIPPENPADYYWLSSLHGREIHRLSLPSHRALEELRRQIPFSAGERLHWSPYIKCNVGQDVVDRTLRDHLAGQPTVDLRVGWRFEGFTDEGDQVVAQIRDLRAPADSPSVQVRADFLVGCDGGRSSVRTELGIRYEGAGSIAQFVSIYFRSPDLMDAHRFGPANIYFPLHRDHAGYLINWDRGESWTYHLELGSDETWDEVDPVARVTALVGQPITVDVLSVQPWTAHALTATAYRKDRAFLAGDAAHLFTPTGGFGMNTGVSDAIDLAWKLEAALSGWGGDGLLDSYEAERRPIGVRNTQLARELYDRLASVMTHGDELDAEGPEADTLRADLHADLVEQESLIASFGVLLGYRYEDSPICVADGTEPPIDHPQQYVPTSRPGHRAPHVWLDGDEALLDRFGVGFTLVVTDATVDTRPLQEAAERVGMPLDVVRAELPDMAEVYPRALTLVRPDLMVAWRADGVPDDCGALIDRVRGVQPAATG